jgi:2'-5' RNA ligase
VRLFIGIEIDGVAKAAVMSAGLALRARAEDPRWAVAARWVPVENLHITLWFIGNLPDARGALVLSAMASPFETPVFTIELGGLGVFPPSGAPRVFWMGVRAGADALVALHAEIGGRLEPLGFEPERRGYSAHLTLARIKAVNRGAYGALRTMVREFPAPGARSVVNAATVFQSRVSSKGSAYTPVLRVPLS